LNPRRKEDGEREKEQVVCLLYACYQKLYNLYSLFLFFSLIEEKHSSGKTVPTEIKLCLHDHFSQNILSGAVAVWDQLEAITEIHQIISALPLLLTFLQQIFPLWGIP